MKRFIKLSRNSIILGFLFFSMTACSLQDLVTKKVLNNKLSILLPKDFDLMQNEMLEVKYPIAERRPTEVYTDESGAINVALNITQNQVTQEQLPEVEKALKNQFSSTLNITFNTSVTPRQ